MQLFFVFLFFFPFFCVCQAFLCMGSGIFFFFKSQLTGGIFICGTCWTNVNNLLRLSKKIIITKRKKKNKLES